MVFKEDMCLNRERGFGARLMGTDIKADVFAVTFSFVEDMTEYKLD